jgi:hypothetical protein
MCSLGISSGAAAGFEAKRLVPILLYSNLLVYFPEPCCAVVITRAKEVWKH